MSLIDSLIQENWLKTERIIRAFQKIERRDFLPEDMKDLAELNEALLIGSGQTISQPLVVAFMLELLLPKPGDKILDIGSGSGWTTALLAHIVSQKGNSKFQIPNNKQIPNSNGPAFAKATEGKQNSKGKVIAIEIIPELKEFGEKNVAKYNFIEKGIAEFICADGSKGYKKEAPFDRILASASAEKIPPVWKEQLKIEGRIVTPIGSSIWLFVKKTPSFAKVMEGKEKEFEETEYPGFVFVPLVSKQ